MMVTHYSSNTFFTSLRVTLTCLFVLMATNVNTGNALSFKFSKFSPSSKLTLQGTAEILPSGVLSLTKHDGEGDVQLNTGRVVYNKSVTIWDSNTSKVASFATTFCFEVDDIQATTPADGIAFFFSSNPEIPIDSSGGNLGIVSGSTSNQVVAVEFDSFSNEWDPIFPHIGIDVNSLSSSNTVQWNRESGSLVQATILYNGKTKTLRATLTNKNGAITSVDQVVDLKDVLPEKVTVGISGTTGGAFETHDIHSWSFTLEPHHGIDITKIPSYACEAKANN